MAKNRIKKKSPEGQPSKDSKWKQVQLEGSLKVKGFQEGLLGIEVMDDYKMVGKTSGKRKMSQAPDDLSSPAKKKKKRNYRKPRKSKKKIQEESLAKEGGQEGNPEPQKKGKKKAKKKEKMEQNDDEEEEEDVVLDMEKMVLWSDLCLPEVLLKALQTQGFAAPTPIQRSLLPHALGGKLDILGAAETGSGKTLAFGLPILKGILEDMEKEKEGQYEGL